MKNLLRLLLTTAGLAAVYLAYRYLEEGAEPLAPPTDTEPVLGYDGMDLGTLLPWLEAADPDRDTLLRIRDYEAAHRARESVLELVDELLQ